MNRHLDERQLLQRGNTLRHGLITMMFLVLLDAFLKSNEIVMVEGVWSSVLIVVFVSTLCMHENILRDVFDLEMKSSKQLILFFGIGGALLLTWSLVDIITGSASVISNGQLTKDGVSLVMAMCWFSVLFTYFVKTTKLRQSEEES